ncbi:MAG: hypothetical protein HPY81_01205 [Firmicutes bacterium]|nr:hypothetical protein [Bacillota bacterium]
MSRKLRLVLSLTIIFVLTLVLSGCAKLNIETKINKDGSGYRKLQIFVPKSDFNEIKGGQPALDETIRANLPRPLDLQIQSDSNGVTYVMNMQFSSIQELIGKSDEILGKSSGIICNVSGSPFNQTFTYREPNKPDDYFAWAINAVKKAGLTSRSELVDTTNGTFILPSGSRASWYGNVDLQDRYSQPIKHLSINTNLKDIKNPSRKIEITLDESTAKVLNEGGTDKVLDYFNKQLGDGYQITRNDGYGLVTYVIAYTSKDFDAFQKASAKIFTDEKVNYELVPNSSKLFPVYRFYDNFIPANFFGSRVEILEPVEYVVLYPGNQLAQVTNTKTNASTIKTKEEVTTSLKTNTSSVGLEEKGKRTVTAPAGQRISIEDRFQKTSPLFFGVLGGFGLFLAVLIIVSSRFFMGFEAYARKQQVDQNDTLVSC